MFRWTGLIRLVLAALVLLSGVAGATEREIVDNVVHVRNSDQPRDGVTTLQMEELWRIGDDDDEILGLIPRICADTAGNIYVLDSQLCQVSVYSPKGDLLRTLFKEGDGPGEIRQPRDLMAAVL